MNKEALINKEISLPDGKFNVVDVQGMDVYLRKVGAKGGKPKIVKFTDHATIFRKAAGSPGTEDKPAKNSKGNGKGNGSNGSKKAEKVIEWPKHEKGSISVSKVIEIASSLTHPKAKEGFLKEHMDAELKFLLQMSRKSEPSKGVSDTRVTRWVNEHKEEADKRPDHYNPHIRKVVADIVADGKKRFELSKEEKTKLFSQIPKGSESIYGKALGRKLSVGLSDSKIDEITK